MFREKGSWIKQIFGNKIISNCRKPSLIYSICIDRFEKIRKKSINSLILHINSLAPNFEESTIMVAGIVDIFLKTS